MASYKVTVADSAQSNSQTVYEIEGDSIGVGGETVSIYKSREIVFVTTLTRLVGLERVREK